jgi:hypothetical protein
MVEEADAAREPEGVRRLVAAGDVATAGASVHEATAEEITVANCVGAMPMADMAIVRGESDLVITVRQSYTRPAITGHSVIPRGVLATIPLMFTVAPESRSALEWDGV